MSTEKTSMAQFKALLKKIQEIQLDAVDILSAADSFNLEYHTVVDGNTYSNPLHTIYVSISPYEDESLFHFYDFYTIEENQATLDRLREYMKTRKKLTRAAEDVFK